MSGRPKTLLEQRGLLANDEQHFERDELAEDHPLLALLYGASIQSRIALGRRAGQRIQRIGDRIDPDAIERGSAPRCASVGGIHLHADVALHGNDRRGLERLARYILRPPLAQERLSSLPDGRILYRLKTPWKDGTHHLVFEPIDFIGKLAALVPPPRANQVRYHGVFAPCHPWRDWIVSELAQRDISTRPTMDRGSETGPSLPVSFPSVLRPRRLSWAQLLRRVFRIDALICPNCGGHRRIIAAITDPAVAACILEALAISRGPPKPGGPAAACPPRLH